MARSRKKTPKAGITTARSEKIEKQANHRRERRRIRQKLGTDPTGDVLPAQREVSNRWVMAKEGKVYLGARASRRDLKK